MLTITLNFILVVPLSLMLASNNPINKHTVNKHGSSEATQKSVFNTYGWIKTKKTCEKKGNRIWVERSQINKSLYKLMDIRCCLRFSFFRVNRIPKHKSNSSPQNCKQLCRRHFSTTEMSIQSQLPTHRLKVDSVGFSKTFTVQIPLKQHKTGNLSLNKNLYLKLLHHAVQPSAHYKFI